MNISKLKNDIPASIVVFLVALPLCLGIALASGAPLLSGIIAGIVGGIVVGTLSGSHTSVSGPAAGLAAVVLSSITQLGAFELFLTAVIIAGFIQLLMGYLKAGIFANYIPSNVIKGLLAAIGIILILKQIPHALGYDADFEGDFSFSQWDGENTFSELIKAFGYIAPSAVFISVVSLFILIIWDKTPMKKVKFFPASLFVVIMSMLIDVFVHRYLPQYAISSNHLVNIPEIDSSNLSLLIHFPELSHFANYNIWIVAFTVAIIASIETLLNVEAIDKIDPHKRETPANRELLAQGAGNIVSGFLGGIPVTSVIVRSSVNIQAGNATKLSAIIHGFLMLGSIVVLSPLLNRIPLAALAAILLVVGYKLAKVEIFKDMYKKGWDQFVPFIVTIVGIVFTDILIGVIIGSFTSVFYLMRSNFRNPFVREENTLHIGEVVRLELPTQVSFFNKASIKETLWNVPENTKVLIDASYSDYIDSDVLEIIDDYKNVVAPERNIQLNILGLKDKYKLTDHIQFINVLDKETQQKLTPGDVLDLLKNGNERFVNGKWTDKYLLHQVNATSMGQNPMAVLLGCIDSRTSPEILFDSGIGDLLTIRIAGNIINPEIIGSLEISVKKLGAKLIVVKGHSNCGAVALSLANVMDESIHTVTSKILTVAKNCGCYPDKGNLSDLEVMEKVSKENVRNSIKEILEKSPYLKSRIEKGEVGIVSAYHNVTEGVVYFDELI
ncbi:MAG: SulP family inorganic anion transporter [Cyclobacteriaceae bacterium]|nr:SulP family inorganic anion transporter [Cyclobacteriaceae bacterium]